MFTSHQNAVHSHIIKRANNSIKIVATFKYVGMTVHIKTMLMKKLRGD